MTFTASKAQLLQKRALFCSSLALKTGHVMSSLERGQKFSLKKKKKKSSLPLTAFSGFGCFKWGNITPFPLLPEGMDFLLKEIVFHTLTQKNAI